MRKVKNKRTIGVIGKEQFKFEISKEEDIYLHCCGLLEERKEKKLECRVNTYSEWKKGIQQKYEGKKEDFLEEFSRYLQNLININYPILEYNRIAVGVLMSVSLSVLTTEFIQNWNVPSTLSVLETYLLDFLVFLLLMGGITFVIYATFSPVKDQSMRIAFLNDYKEIIDELIENKKSNPIAN